MNYKTFRNHCYQEAAQANFSFHGERHAYAHERYRTLTGVSCPIEANIKHGHAHRVYIATELKISLLEAESLDKEARQQIAIELGHNRLIITNAYLG